MANLKEKQKDKNGGTIYVTYSSGRKEEIYSKTVFGIKHDATIADLTRAKEMGAVKEFKCVRNKHE